MLSKVKEEQEIVCSDEKSRRHPRWTRQETLTLIQAKDITENGPNKGRKIWSSLSSENTEPKWVMISAYCRQQGANRGPAQCRKRWSNLIGDYRKVKAWEANLRNKSESFWIMRNDLRKEKKLPVSFDREVFKVLAGREMGSADAVSPLPLQAVVGAASVCYGNADEEVVEEEEDVDEDETGEDVGPEDENELTAVNAGQSPDLLVSDELQETPVRDKMTVRLFEGSPVEDKTVVNAGQLSDVMLSDDQHESPGKDKMIARDFEESPVKDQTTVRHFEETPDKDEATARHFEESPVKDQTTARHLEESPVKATSAARHLEESPVKAKTTAKRFEESPPEPDSEGLKESAWPGISYWDSKEKGKRRRLSTDDPKANNVQAQIMKVLETNNKLLTAQLDNHNKNIQLDREQRKESNDVLVAALGKLTNVLVKIAEKL